MLALFCLAVSCTKASSPNCVMLDGKQVCSLGSIKGVPEVAPNLALSVVVENGKVVSGGETVARLDVRKITVRYGGPLRNGGVI